jgi:beta-mannosidase
MRPPRSALALLTLGFLLIAGGARANSWSLSGSDWFIHSASSPQDTAAALAEPAGPDWIPATVPGNIQADLEAAHLIGPLWYGSGDPRLPGVATKYWWYRKDFVLPPTYNGKRLTLIFNGVDFGYEIWLNGKPLGRRAGQFLRSEFDISGIAKVGATNRLAVRIEPIPSNLEHCWAADPPVSGLGTPDWLVDCYTRALYTLEGLKSATNVAYDWGVNIFTLGIWRNVWIEDSGPARINWMSVRTDLSDGYHRALAHMHLEIDSEAPVTARATFRVTGPGFDQSLTTQPQELSVKQSDVDATLPIQNPALWWPNGQGSQPLYHVEVTLTDPAGRELDSKSAHFGIREIRWTQVEGVPANFPNPYQLVVNGRKIRMMGSDLVPPDLLFGRDGLYAPRLLHLAKAAGMNTLRLWGGGVILPRQFYDLADKLGIMLSQEFPLANTIPPGDPVFVSNVEHTITDIVKELRNHPSIIEWSGGNEMPWLASNANPSLDAMRAVCAANDDRIFRATDPIEGSRHSPWFFIPQISYQLFNGIWQSPKDPTGPLTMDVMRYGEFGSQTPTSLDVFEREIPPASQWPLDDINDPVLVRKNLLQAAFNPLDWLYKPVIEGYFGPLAGPADLIKAGQYIGADSLRYFVDELRRKGRKIGDLTTWDYDEPWSNGAGSFLVDHDGEPLMNYYFMKEALAPVSLTLRYSSNLYNPSKGLTIGLWLTSDAPQPVHGVRWNWTARDRSGEVLGQGNGTASIEPGEARKLRDLVVPLRPATALGPVVVELHAVDSAGDVLTDRVEIFGSDNSVSWPLYGLLHDSGPNPDDRTIKPPRAIRILWVQDPLRGPYDDTAWPLRRFGVRVTYVPAAASSFGKVAPTTAALLHDYDVIWIGAPDPANPAALGRRLGARNLDHIAAAVRAGLGIGFEGGPESFAAAGFAGTPLQAVLPVQSVPPDQVVSHQSASIVVADPASPLVSGRLATTLPRLGGYVVLKAKSDSHTVLKTASADPVLLTRRYGRGRVLGFASSITTDWQSYRGWGWNLRAWSGFPMLVARMFSWLSGAPDSAVRAIDLPDHNLTLRVGRTTIRLAQAAKFAGSRNDDQMTILLENTGSMTALFCSPKPILEYRPDLNIDNDFVSIPPGETRTMTVRARTASPGELGLSQEGWQVSCWNADAIRIPSSRSVLLSFGRRDSMTREFAGPGASLASADFSGSHPDAHRIPWSLPLPETSGHASTFGNTLEFTFQVTAQDAARPSWLNINTADQSHMQAAEVGIEVNGHQLAHALQKGLGEQLKDPAHLAFAETARFALPAGTWRPGRNTLEIRANTGWFTWDSLVLFTSDALRTANARH